MVPQNLSIVCHLPQPKLPEPATTMLAIPIIGRCAAPSFPSHHMNLRAPIRASWEKYSRLAYRNTANEHCQHAGHGPRVPWRFLQRPCLHRTERASNDSRRLCQRCEMSRNQCRGMINERLFECLWRCFRLEHSSNPQPMMDWELRQGLGSSVQDICNMIH